MAFLGVVLLALCFAEEVVELEPVKSGNYDCNTITADVTCKANPYCYWHNGPNTCIDDPCLTTGNLPESASSDDDCPGKQVGSDNIDCKLQTVATDRDCIGGSGKFCVSTTTTANYVSDYCFYANIRDGGANCPPTLCNYAGHQCKNPDSIISECTLLNTRAECGLVPKCYWSSNACLTDPCFSFGTISPPNTCQGWEISGAHPCVPFKPWIGGAQVDYCVHTDNNAANICYFGTPYATTTGLGNTDYQSTFPTFNSTSNTGLRSGSPVCTGTIGTGCEGNGECVTIIQGKGAFAGKYCTDGTHGSAGANILYIPSLLLVLALSFMLAV